ncbi:Uncharacterized protein Fot_19619 [Forsythia ovata]|uniref:Uncharacterized protein n=1 Tax=Forsythia ovata TaxID=205694 RepID=A0ABD1VLM7_9LAMI
MEQSVGDVLHIVYRDAIIGTPVRLQMICKQRLKMKSPIKTSYQNKDSGEITNSVSIEKEFQGYLNAEGPSKDFNEFGTKLAGLTRNQAIPCLTNDQTCYINKLGLDALYVVLSFLVGGLTFLNTKELDLSVMELFGALTLAKFSRDSGCLDNLDAMMVNSMTRGHLSVYLFHSTIQSDTIVLDCGRVLLKDLIKFPQEIPEFGLGAGPHWWPKVLSGRSSDAHLSPSVELSPPPGTDETCNSPFVKRLSSGWVCVWECFSLHTYGTKQ